MKMEVDEHLLWLLSALKLTRGCDEMNKNKIIQNVNNCFLRVKKDRNASNTTANQSTEEIRNFQAKATVMLLLCLPKIRELTNVEKCEDFQSILSSVPELSDSIFFTLVRSQKMYFLLSPLLSWLPPHVLQTLSMSYFHHTSDVTPVTLTMSVELLRALLFSHQYRCIHPDDCHNNTECLHLLVKFLSSKNVSSETPSVIKFSGYLFMYMLECLYLLLAAYVGRRLRNPETLPCVEAWTNLWKTDKSTKYIQLSFTKESIKSLLMLCHSNNREVTVDMWMEWSEQMLPLTVMVHASPAVQLLAKGCTKSIQLVICNVAFDILRILEAHSHLEEDLASSEYHELLQFLQQVATDPEYDPDQDLSLQQLIKEINVKDERQEKLLGILVQRDGVIESHDACACLKEHSAALDNQMKIDLLHNCIEWIKGNKPYIPESKDVVLDLASELNTEDLKPIIEGSLSAGLDDTLITPCFKTQLTSVFNQLADENIAEPSGRHVWLCLQSGRGVVEQAVRLAVTMPGLVPVMVQALADVPGVCHAKLPSGNSVLASTLVEWQSSDLCDREEQEFIVLVKHLLSTKTLLNGEEVLHLMVEPFIVIECSTDLDKLILPLQLLKEVVTQDVGVVVRPGAAVVSLVLALLHVMDATVCLEAQAANVSLAIRSLVSAVLTEITNTMASNLEKFKSEITLLKGMLPQYSFHPLSVMHVTKVLDAELSGDSGADLLLHALMKLSSELPQGQLRDMTCAAADSTGLKRMSTSEWVISLLQILPHCSESAWRSAFFLSDCVLASQDAVFAVLGVLMEVLHLVCESVADTTQHTEQPSHCLPPPVSLHHCFTFFASAAVIYLEEKFQAQNPREKFLNLADTFRWWCCSVPSFCCNPELPSLLLARLCGLMEDIVVSGQLKVLPEEHTQTSSYCNGDSSNVTERETDLVPRNHVNEVDIRIGEEEGEKCEEMDICDKEGFCISRMMMKKEMELITFSVVTYVPSSNLLSSVASKLKKLHQF